MRKLLLVTLLCALLSSPARAGQRGNHASGFMLQGLLGAGTSVLGGAGPFIAAPGLRIGGMLKPLAVSANVTFASISDLSGTYQGTHLITAGPDFAPFVWTSPGGQARLYLLAGFNAGVQVSTGRDAVPTGGLSLGVGGIYFMHPSFALGTEIGSRTQFSRVSASDLTATAYLYAAISGTFVAGR